MAHDNLIFCVNSYTVTISGLVLDTLWKQRQNLFYKAEAGGQLFARFNEKSIFIEACTTPNSQDIRGRFKFIPNRKLEQSEINTHYMEGLHFIGDWHTHPQDIPIPSGIDLSSALDRFKKSEHNLEFMILMVVGRVKFPSGLWIGSVDLTSIQEQSLTT